jgi:hypothetical protein
MAFFIRTTFLVAAFVLTGSIVHAQQHQGSGTYITPQGTGTYQNVVVANPDGSITVNGTRVNPQGGTVTNQRTITRVENGRVITGTTTGPNGQTATFNNTVTKTGEGQWQGTREVTGPNGNTKTINTTGQRTDDGVQKTQTWTGKNGQERSRDVQWKNNGQGSATKTITPQNGQARTIEFQRNKANKRQRNR